MREKGRKQGEKERGRKERRRRKASNSLRVSFSKVCRYKVVRSDHLQQSV